MTDTIARYLTEDHRRCDRLLADCEAAIASRSWPASDTAAAGLRDALLHHFALEEEVLFPEVEQASPAASGPTGVMRMEHRQMRQLLDELAASVQARDRENCLGELETLHMIGQQHNSKEEGILYPLADNALGDRADAMAKRLQAA